MSDQNISIDIIREKLEAASARRLARKELVGMMNAEWKKEILKDMKEKMMLRKIEGQSFYILSNEELSVIEDEIERFRADGLFKIIGEKALELVFYYAILRHNYLVGKDSISAVQFRNASDEVAKALVDSVAVQEELDIIKTVVVLPWRAGLAFGEAAINEKFKNIYHIGMVRDEKTLDPHIYFEQFPLILRHDPRQNRGLKALICDPMLATGGTAGHLIRHLRKKGIKEESITVACMIAAPEGVFNLLSHYPKIRIHAGEYDEKLDSNGFIAPGLGDFGEAYFGEGINDRIKKWADLMILDIRARNALKLRMEGKTAAKDFENI